MISKLVFVAIELPIFRSQLDVVTQKRLLMVPNIVQGLANCTHYCPGCDGGAGKLVEYTAILGHRPLFPLGLTQGAAVEGQNPVGFPEFNLVPKAGCFTV